MFRRIPGVFCLIFASLAFGQLGSNSVTLTASGTVALQADQAVFAVFVDSDFNTTLNDVVAALQGSGITLANFSSVNTTQYPGVVVGSPVFTSQPVLEWAFRFVVPLSTTKDTVAMLTGLQQSLQKNNGLKLSFSIQGTQVSQQLRQSQICVIPDLIANARAQAQKLAGAAGRTLGGILAMSSATSDSTGSGILNLGSPLVQSSSAPICSVTIMFGLQGS